ncbi:UNVERIFIED_CONTAM: hypothetical protein FKN15_055519 [Acipenser sinensis]
MGLCFPQEVTASSRHYVDRLFDPDPQKVLLGVIDMKNAVIGNNKQKANLIVLGAVPRLLYLLQQDSSGAELRTECAVVLGSLAMGTENNVKSLVDCHIIPALLQGLLSQDLKFIEACLRCLRTVFISTVTPVQLLYTVQMQALKCFSVLAYENPQVSMTLVQMQALKCFSVLAYENPQVSMTLVNGRSSDPSPHVFVKPVETHTGVHLSDLLSLLQDSRPSDDTLQPRGYPEHCTPPDLLFIQGEAPEQSSVVLVQMQALKCFSVLAYENPQVSMTLVNVHQNCQAPEPPSLYRCVDLKLFSLFCSSSLTYMCRAGAIRTDDNYIVLKTLPCLVRMCSKERLLEERVDGAETLAYLIEPDVELQRIASITDHLIAMLADYFKYPSSLDHDLKHAHELRQAAFKLYASLGRAPARIKLLYSRQVQTEIWVTLHQAWPVCSSSVGEESGQKTGTDRDLGKAPVWIIETETMMDRIVSGLSESSIKVRLAAVRCLHSLSRSVQQLRTSFQDHAVWKPLMKIIETENMMDRIVSGLSESSIKVRLAAVRCLHSLSRSVQQLRTSFQDHAVWKPLMKLLQNAPEEVLVMASSTLCNLLLEFSPSKEPILESGAIDLLCSLTRSESPALRVNGIWALMNMAFQAEQKIKMDILRALSTEQLFRLLSDPDVNPILESGAIDLLCSLTRSESPALRVNGIWALMNMAFQAEQKIKMDILRALSTEQLFRLLSDPDVNHIDQIMSSHGKQIMQAVTLILEGEHNIEVKEQTLCILANIADGTTAKDLIMINDDILQKIKYYMGHSNVKLQLTATFCISNLIWNEEEGSQERQDRLREMGFVDILHKLTQSADPSLCDR